MTAPDIAETVKRIRERHEVDDQDLVFKSKESNFVEAHRDRAWLLDELERVTRLERADMSSQRIGPGPVEWVPPKITAKRKREMQKRLRAAVKDRKP